MKKCWFLVMVLLLSVSLPGCVAPPKSDPLPALSGDFDCTLSGRVGESEIGGTLVKRGRSASFLYESPAALAGVIVSADETGLRAGVGGIPLSPSLAGIFVPVRLLSGGYEVGEIGFENGTTFIEGISGELQRCVRLDKNGIPTHVEGSEGELSASLEIYRFEVK